MIDHDESDPQVQRLAERFRDLLNDCWDVGIQVVHDAQVDGHCQGDYALRWPGDDAGAAEVHWYPLVERWGVA